jgi:hypothetical protein
VSERKKLKFNFFKECVNSIRREMCDVDVADDKRGGRLRHEKNVTKLTAAVEGGGEKVRESEHLRHAHTHCDYFLLTIFRNLI